MGLSPSAGTVELRIRARWQSPRFPATWNSTDRKRNRRSRPRRARAAAIAGGWPAATTRTSPSPAACSPAACGNISTISTPIAAGPTTWPTRPATRKRSLALLDWWEQHLHACYRGQTFHPVFIALAATIGKFDIPPDPFVDLLVAFRQDQRVRRYEDFGKLLNYCRYSANPVGRLVLYLGRCHTPERAAGRLGLHRAAIGQLLPGRRRGFGRGRIYLPLADCRRFGYEEAMFARRECNEPFRRLLAAEVDQAEGYLRRGLPLVPLMPPELQLDVALFVHGGLAILEAIRRQDYDVWTARPKVSKFEKLGLVASCWWRLLRGTLLKDEEHAEKKA